METNFKELVSQYEALWENDTPREQIVEFCRQHLDEDETLFYILINSVKWGNMVVMPSFLKHLRDDDDSLLRGIASYLRSQHRLDYYDFFVTVSRILSMKSVLSDKVRATFWTVLKNVGWHYSGYVREGCEDMTLVDNEGIRSAILKRREKGHDLISKGIFFMDDKRFIPLSDKIIQALQIDSASMFEMALTLTGKKITVGLLRAILRAHAFNILTHLLKCRTKALAALLSPHDLLICICTAPSSPNESEINVLNALEELSPGISQRTDKLGNTPLWYCLYHGRKEKLEEALIQYGCNPDTRNHLNLSYNICKEFRDL